jgi:hypothetical protein
VQTLHLPTRVTLLAGKIQTNQRECRADGARMLSDVLSAVGINRVLVDEGAVSARQGVATEFAVKLPTFSGRMVPFIGLGLRRWEPDAAPGARSIKRHSHKATSFLSKVFHVKHCRALAFQVKSASRNLRNKPITPAERFT